MIYIYIILRYLYNFYNFEIVEHDVKYAYFPEYIIVHNTAKDDTNSGFAFIR